MRKPGMGNPESGSGLPAEMHGVFTSGDGVQKNGRKEYKRDTKKTCIEEEKILANGRGLCYSMKL